VQAGIQTILNSFADKCLRIRIVGTIEHFRVEPLIDRRWPYWGPNPSP
jgi:hypothetical protein